MTDQYNVLFPQEYLNTPEDSTVFGDQEPYGKGKKVPIMQKGEDGDGKLVFLPEHWGTCFGINESIYEEKDETKKKEETEKKDEAPKFEVCYILENTKIYADNKDNMSEGAQQLFDAFELFTKRIIAHLKSEDVIEDFHPDLQLKMKGDEESQKLAIRPIVVYPKKDETKVSKKNGKVTTKVIKVTDMSKPPRIYGLRVLKTQKGVWISTFDKRLANPDREGSAAKDDDAIFENGIDPNTLMGQSSEIQPVILLDSFFVKENKLCLQLKLLEATVIPFSFRKLGGLAAKKMGRNYVASEGFKVNIPGGEEGDEEGDEEKSKEDSEAATKARRRANRAARHNKTEGDDAEQN